MFTFKTFYTIKFIYEDYVNKYGELIDGDIETAWNLFNEPISLNDIQYFYLADLCIKNVDNSPYEWYDGNKDIIEKLTKRIKKYYDIECESI